MMRQTLLERALILGNQDSALMEKTRHCVAQRCAMVEVCADLPADLRQCDLAVIITDVYGNRVGDHMRALRVLDVPVLVIALEPGEIWLAPTLLPGRSGCFFCFKDWVHNNIRQNHHWTAAREPVTQLARVATKPLTTPVMAAFEQILQRRLEEIAKVDARAQDVVRIQTDKLKISHHPLIPYPQCSLCDTRPQDSAQRATIRLQPRLKRQATDFRAANSKLDPEHLKRDYVDRWTGMIKHVFHSINSDLMPLYAAEAPIFFDKNIEVGYGRTETREKSEMVSILEALERFSGQTSRGVKNLVRGSYNQLREHAVDPREFILHDAEQRDLPGFNLLAYSDDLECNWKWAYSLRGNRPVLVPEQLVYYWLKAEEDRPVNRFVYDSSNGCALGGSMEEAMLYGLLEVAERDAYFTTWYARITPREIDLDGIRDDRIRTLIARSKAQGYELHVFDMRLDIDIPVVWAMIVDPMEDAPVKSYCAAGAHFDPEQAIFGALVEVTTSMGVYRRSLPQFRVRAYELLLDPDQVQQMNDHVLLYSLPETYAQLSFLFAGEGRKHTIDELYGPTLSAPKNLDLTDDLRTCVDKILRVAADVIVVDLGFEQLHQSGLSCVKVLAPGLSPVTFGHQYRRPSLRRINRALAHLNLPTGLDMNQLNSFPHNFP